MFCSRWFLFLALGCLFLSADSPARSQPPDDGELIRRVGELAGRAVLDHGAVSFSVAVARGEKVLFAGAFGMADLEHEVAASSGTMFRIGSITKQFTAAAVMRLKDQGKLSLDDDILRFLPDYPTQGHTVTIRHLLTHTSGIGIYTTPEFMQNRTSLELTPAQVLAEFKDDPFEFAPGEKWSYNNSAYYLLGLIIEKAAGKPYGQFLQDEFFGPLKLTCTRYDSTGEVIRNRAQGYRLEAGRLVNDQPFAMGIPGGAGGLISTAGDLVRWQMALAGGQVVSADSWKEMCTPVVLNGGEVRNYGLGLQLREYRGRKRIGHGGGIAGFNSMLSFFPEQELHIAVISGSEDASASDLADAIAFSALGLVEEEILDLELSADAMRCYAGRYRLEDGSLDAAVFVRDGKLFLQATGQPEFRLKAQGNHEFRADFDTDVKLVFAAGDEPAPSFILHQGGSKIAAKRIPDGG